MAFLRLKNKLTTLILPVFLLVGSADSFAQPSAAPEVDIYDVQSNDVQAPKIPNEDDIKAFTDELFGEGDIPAPPAFPVAPPPSVAPKASVEPGFDVQEDLPMFDPEIEESDVFSKPSISSDVEVQPADQAASPDLPSPAQADSVVPDIADDVVFGSSPPIDKDMKDSLKKFTEQKQPVEEPSENDKKPVVNGKTDEEKAQYRQLKSHLMNFIKSFSEPSSVDSAGVVQKPVNDIVTAEDDIFIEDDEIFNMDNDMPAGNSTMTGDLSENSVDMPEQNKIPDVVQYQPNIEALLDNEVEGKQGESKESPTPEGGVPYIAENVEEFLGNDADSGEAEVLSEELEVEPDYLQADNKEEAEADFTERLGDKITKISEDEVTLFAGQCIDLEEKISNCVEFSCTMPQSKGSSNNILISVMPRVDGSCRVIQKLEDSKDALFACNLDTSGRQQVAQKVLSHFESSGAVKFNLSDEQILGCFEDEEVLAARIAKIPVPIARVIEPVTTVKKELTAEDKAYIALMNEKRKLLPRNKQLSGSTRNAIEDISPSLLPEENIKQDKETQHIAIRRGRGAGSSSAQMSMSETQEGVNFNIKEKMDMAYRALLAGQISASVSLYKEVLDVDHENQDALFGLATAYHRNSQYEQARSIYIELLKIEPDNKEVLNNFLVLVAEESPENALIELQKLERINSDFSPIPAQIAMIYLKNNNPEKAERYLRRAVILSPDNMTYKYNLAITSDRLGKNYQAARLYRQVLEAMKNGALVPGSREAIMDRLLYLEEKIRTKG